MPIIINPTPGLPLLTSTQLARTTETMPDPTSLPANEASGSPSQPLRRRSTQAFRLLDWTNLDSAPTSMDVARMAGIGGCDGSARLAVVVNTPRMLRAADVFAEQAGLQGAQVRVFVNAGEALAWLYRDQPTAYVVNQWPDRPSSSLRVPTSRS